MTNGTSGRPMNSEARSAFTISDAPAKDIEVLTFGFQQIIEEGLLRDRAKRGDREAALAILSGAPDYPPDEGDEIPEDALGSRR